MNLKVLKKSRILPAVGDIFVLQLGPLPDRYFFGRVVKTDAKVGGFNDTIPIYIYSTTSPSKTIDFPLTPGDLLVPPVATNRQPWNKGYFEMIGHQQLTSTDLLPRHVFRDPLRKRLFDDCGREVTSFDGLIGTDGLHSYQTIDYEISRALGLALFS
jgi:Immunity protein 26